MSDKNGIKFTTIFDPISTSMTDPNLQSTPGGLAVTEHPKYSTIKSTDTSTTFIPDNWAVMLGINKTKYEKDSNSNSFEEDMFLSFTCYQCPIASFINLSVTDAYEMSNMQKLGTYKFLHPSGSLQEKIKHTYDNGSLLYQAWSGLVNTAGGVLNSLVSATSTQRGIILEKPEFYSESERRTFNITLNLFGYNNLKNDIYGAINFFRNNSYPERYKGTAYIEYPSVFKISGGAFNTNQSSHTYFRLKDMDITYNDKQPYFKGGLPIQATLSLQFQELGQMFYDSFVEGKVSVSIAYEEAEKEIGLYRFEYDKTIEIPSTTQFQPSIGTKFAGNSLLENIEGKITNSALAKRLNNISGTLDNLVQNKINSIITSSSIYKKITDIINIDPIHTLEINKINKEGTGSSKNIPQEKINDIKEDMAETPIDIKIPIEKLKDIKDILKRIRV